jgi:hypothetical protein
MTSMHALQYWLFKTLHGITATVPFMHSKWGWPAVQVAHFLGLSMLVGTIFMFDLRMLGMAKGIPIGALHKLIPWGIAGYLVNVGTGFMFLTASPDQYVYNSAFQLKMLFMALAGFNILIFYLLAFRQAKLVGPDGSVPLLAKLAAGSSLFLWTGVIVLGRMIAFHRPAVCPPNKVVGFVATCFIK